MKITVFLMVLFTGLSVSAANGASPAKALPADSGYHLLKQVHLGGEGFWDYMTMDGQARRLYITHGTHVMVLDADSYQVVGDIPDTQGVHGVALAPEFGRGFTSNGRTATVTIFDLKSLKKIGEAKTEEGPDGILYDPASKRVFTFNGPANSTTAIDAATGHVAGSVALGGRPEFAVADGEGHLFNNLEDKSEVVEIDSRGLKVVNRWPLAPCESPSGMAMDTEHRRLFIGCHNQMMAVMNADSGKVVATVPIGRGVDANRFDPRTQLAYSSNGDGTVTVVHEDSPDKYSVIENVQTERGARTMEIDPQTHRIFTVTAQFGEAPPPKPGERFSRPPILPDSFELLVFGK
ncbi:MAG: YncE family protein [Deltaproteobacteria bacterium]